MLRDTSIVHNPSRCRSQELRISPNAKENALKVMLRTKPRKATNGSGVLRSKSTVPCGNAMWVSGIDGAIKVFEGRPCVVRAADLVD